MDFVAEDPHGEIKSSQGLYRLYIDACMSSCPSEHSVPTAGTGAFISSPSPAFSQPQFHAAPQPSSKQTSISQEFDQSEIVHRSVRNFLATETC